jgi:hypothetical protein
MNSYKQAVRRIYVRNSNVHKDAFICPCASLYQHPNLCDTCGYTMSLCGKHQLQCKWCPGIFRIKMNICWKCVNRCLNCKEPICDECIYFKCVRCNGPICQNCRPKKSSCISCTMTCFSCTTQSYKNDECKIKLCKDCPRFVCIVCNQERCESCTIICANQNCERIDEKQQYPSSVCFKGSCSTRYADMFIQCVECSRFFCTGCLTKCSTCTFSICIQCDYRKSGRCQKCLEKKLKKQRDELNQKRRTNRYKRKLRYIRL